ncbi:MAG: hypothetical protein ACJ8I3_00980, partial [Paraburkholderia graminis]
MTCSRQVGVYPSTAFSTCTHAQCNTKCKRYHRDESTLDAGATAFKRHLMSRNVSANTTSERSNACGSSTARQAAKAPNTARRPPQRAKHPPARHRIGAVAQQNRKHETETTIMSATPSHEQAPPTIRRAQVVALTLLMVSG